MLYKAHYNEKVNDNNLCAMCMHKTAKKSLFEQDIPTKAYRVVSLKVNSNLATVSHYVQF
jgi:hypothetical protein